MSGGVGIDPKGVRRVSVLGLLQHRRSEGHDEVVRGGWLLDPESRWICCGVPSGQSGDTWSGASCTPTRG
jgi:hypothetical protein